MRDSRGSVVIEFAALAIPFALLLFAILESCISFAGQQVLTNAAEDVARQFRTGQVKAANIDETKLREMICSRIDIVVANGCPGLEVDLKSFNTFAQAAAQKIKIVNNDLDTSDFKVAPGKSLSKNMLRVFYRWPVLTDLISKSMSNLKDGKTLHYATVTWQNEPFDD